VQFIVDELSQYDNNNDNDDDDDEEENDDDIEEEKEEEEKDISKTLTITQKSLQVIGRGVLTHAEPIRADHG
jgi:hypothetical protein